jgi:hypothetical protein
MCNYHTINAGKGDKSKLILSIDFEPIELLISHECLSHPNAFKLDWWQAIIDFCCDVICKEKRTVVVLDDRHRLDNFSETVLEFIYLSEPFNRWAYYMETKTENINNFYKRHKTIKDSQESIMFVQHFEKVFECLKQQGLTDVHSYYAPSNNMIDKLIKQIESK